MKKLILIILLFSSKLHAQDLKVLRFGEFEAMMNPKNEKVYIFNFWATYCKPCISEMPHFQHLAKESEGKVEVIFVSLDFMKDKSKVEDFIKQKQIKQQVVLLNEPDYDSWINKVSDKWSGALPATLILDKSKRKFYEQNLDYKRLVKIMEDFER